MTNQTDIQQENSPVYSYRHLLSIEGLSRFDIEKLLDLADEYVETNRQADKKHAILRGRTPINMFFENSTRTRTSFELAGKRLGGDVINMSVSSSSIKKGETLIDTAMTLNAMHPDVLVVRHADSGSVHLLAEKVNCSVINAGDGIHEHPTQALLDLKTIIDHKDKLDDLNIVIIGDLDHSRVTSSFVEGISNFDIGSLTFCGHPEMCTKYRDPKIGRYEADMATALKDADVVMTLRIQYERFEKELNLDLKEYKIEIISIEEFDKKY